MSSPSNCEIKNALVVVESSFAANLSTSLNFNLDQSLATSGVSLFKFSTQVNAFPVMALMAFDAMSASYKFDILVMTSTSAIKLATLYASLSSPEKVIKFAFSSLLTVFPILKFSF